MLNITIHQDISIIPKQVFCHRFRTYIASLMIVPSLLSFPHVIKNVFPQPIYDSKFTINGEGIVFVLNNLNINIVLVAHSLNHNLLLVSQINKFLLCLITFWNDYRVVKNIHKNYTFLSCVLVE